MSAMRVFGSVADMKAARKSLGSPATLAEAITATGIDALFVLLDGGTVDIEGRIYGLVSVASPTHYDPSSLALCAGCAHAGRFHRVDLSGAATGGCVADGCDCRKWEGT